MQLLWSINCLPITTQTFAGLVVLGAASSVLFPSSSETEEKSVLYSPFEKVIGSLAASLRAVCVDVVVVEAVVVVGFCNFLGGALLLLLLLLLGPFTANTWSDLASNHTVNFAGKFVNNELMLQLKGILLLQLEGFAQNRNERSVLHNGST